MDDINTQIIAKQLVNLAPNLCPSQEAARVVALTRAVYCSADEKRIIRIDPA